MRYLRSLLFCVLAGYTPCPTQSPLAESPVAISHDAYAQNSDPADSSWIGAFGPKLLGAFRKLEAAGTDLYAVGYFSTDSGATWESVARWDGAEWHSLGFGLNAVVEDVKVLGDDIYVGGWFDSAGGVPANNVARWDGSTWSPLGSGTDGGVYALEVIGATLYAGGSFATAGGGIGNSIAQWNGSSWSQMGVGFNNGGSVFEMAAIGNDLYVGGSFPGASGVVSQDIIRWDGASWQAVPPGAARNMESFGNLLLGNTTIYYFVDPFTAWETHAYAFNGASWSEIAFTPAGTGDEPSQSYGDWASSGDGAYLGGEFSFLSLYNPTNYHNIAMWDGAAWSPLGSGTSGETRILTTLGTDLYVLGNFDSAGGKPFPGNARWRMGQAPEWSWAGSAGSGAHEYVLSVAVDDSGNLYVTGWFSASIDFGFGTVSPAGGMDIFLLKYDPYGNIVWARTAGGGDDDFTLGISVDPGGNILLTGAFLSSPMTFDAVSLVKPGTDYDVFTAKYDPAGNVLWARACGGGSADYGYSVTTDGAGNVYTGGAFWSSSLQFSSLPAVTNAGASGSDIFVVKYAPAGTEIRARGDGDAGDEGANALAVDGAGNLCCAGSFTSPSLSFGSNPPLSNSGGQDAFFVRYDTAGVPVWSRGGGGGGSDNARCIGLDPSGNIFVAGTFASPSMVLDTITLNNIDPAAVYTDVFLARYSPDGGISWAREGGGWGVDLVSGLAVDAAGSAIIGGSYSSRQFSLGRFSLENPYYQESDPFVAKYDSGGYSEWIAYTSAAGSDAVMGLGLDPSGNILLAGTFTGPSVRFGHDTLSNTGSGTQDIFVAKLGMSQGGANVVSGISMLSGWNLVSLPVIPQDDSVSHLFPSAVSGAFAYTTGGYSGVSTMEPGPGYWIKYPSAASVDVAGSSLSNLSVTVLEGWNLIGSITTPVEASSITSTPPGLVTGNFFAYAGGYTVTDSLVPGRGYWVKVLADGQLHLESSSATGAAGAAGRIRIVPDSDLPPPPPADGDEPSAHTGLPDRYALGQNYPNPFNPLTLIRYQLPERSAVTIRVYNLIGEVVATLVQGEQDAGYRSVAWDASAFSSGIYFCRMEAGKFVQTRKLVLIK